MDLQGIIFAVSVVVSVLLAVLGVSVKRQEKRDEKELQAELKTAEDLAYLQPLPTVSVSSEIKKARGVRDSDAISEDDKELLKRFKDKAQNSATVGRLLNVYAIQIEKYQQQTRNRASWSFIAALAAMFAGMSFVLWGGFFILSKEGIDHTLAGSSISAIGGGISAYITKTFLDVHKLSINQLNHYFKQPVINEKILMAQQLADDIDDDSFRAKSYEKIINTIMSVIDSNNTVDNE